MTLQIDKVELIAVVMGEAPKEFISVITSEQQSKSYAMTLKGLEVVMYQQWCQMNEWNNKEQDTEIRLREFSGICYQCQQTGHKADSSCTNKKPSEKGDQSSNNKDQEGRGTLFQGNYHNCGKQGHIEQN
jgi:hypothetical protein